VTRDGETPRLDGDRAGRFAAMRRQMEFERKAAPLIVETLLVETPREEWGALAAHPDLVNHGALHHLNFLFERMLPRDPEYAHDVAQLAVRIAEYIPVDGPYPRPIVSQMRAHAWKDLGKYQRFKGRYRESEATLRLAEAMVVGRKALSHDLAIIRFNLAVTLQELDRFGESLVLLSECKAIFRRHGDTTNAMLVAFAEGVLLQLMTRYREAREAYLLIVATTPDLDDEQLAALNNTIGLCSIELGEWDVAADAFDYAATLFSELDQPINALIVETGRGRLYVRSGQFSAGIAHLRPIRRQFLAHGLHEEAGLAGLEIVEGLLGLQNHSAAETLTRKLVREFELAQLNKRAVQALAHLTTILEARTASAPNVRHIREYIDSLRTNPERDFFLTA
jgi:tetratricopeptide (TPR) repeat protein